MFTTTFYVISVKMVPLIRVFVSINIHVYGI